MAYIALYRAWRPQIFKDVIGQEHITQTLRNALKQNRFSHAYLFSGPRGSGKTSAAKIFAKAINCESMQNGEPCNKCNTCNGITKGLIMDIVEVDAASNRGIDEIRELRENVKFTPSESKFKVYIIDEVHMLTTEAFNALLKTLEEPPEHAIFILATTEPHKIPATIISRCQRFDFKRIPAEIMVEHLNYIANTEGFNVEKQALMLIAKYSEGAMRDAISLLDQVLSSSDKDVNINDIFNLTGRVSSQEFSLIAKLISEGKTAQVLNKVVELLYEGKESQRILEDLIYYYRDLLLYKSIPSLEEIKDKIILDKEFPLVADCYSEDQLYSIIETLNKYLTETKFSNQNRIILELGLIKITNHLSSNKNNNFNQDIEDLHKKIKELENKIDNLYQGNLIKKEEVIQNSEHVFSKNNIIGQLGLLNEKLSEENFKKVLEAWPDILQIVKKKKITVYAWFVDGEPLGATDDVIILAFNNIMHRDTTNKEQNIILIEEIISERLGMDYHLFNIMQKDWNLFLRKDNTIQDQTSLIQKGVESEALIAKTTELFSEDLLIIKD